MVKTKDMLADCSTEEIEQGKAIISGVTIEDFGDCLEGLVSPELNSREPFTLSINFFDIPSNIQLLKCCQPVRIKLVDYKKFPHYFKHCAYIKGCGKKGSNKSSFNNLDEKSIVSHNCEEIDDEESNADFVKDIISLENTMAPITDHVQSIDVLSQHSNEYRYMKPKNPSNHRTLQNIPLYTSRPGSIDFISNYEQRQWDKTGKQNTNMDVYVDKSYDNMMEKEKYCWPGYNYYNIHAPYLNFNETQQPFQNNNCYHTYPCYPYSYIPYYTQNQPRAPYCLNPVPLTETSFCKKQIPQNTKKSSDQSSGNQVKNNCEYFKESDSSWEGTKTINITGNNQAIGVKSKQYCDNGKKFTHNMQMKSLSEVNKLKNYTVINCSEDNNFPEPIKNECKPNYSGKRLITKSISEKCKDYLDSGNNSEKHVSTDSGTGNHNEKTNRREEEIKTYAIDKHKDTYYPHKKYNHVEENQFTKSKSKNLRDYVQQNQQIKKDTVVKHNVKTVTGKHVNNTGYSPPILPIPTYQESFDILENMKFIYLDNARIMKCAGRFGYDEQGMLAQKRKMDHQGSGSTPKRISLENYYLKK